jgi:hypothetical protein
MFTAKTSLQQCLSWLIRWLNTFLPPVHSFLEKDLEQWEISFRSYLVQSGFYRRSKRLNGRQEYVDYSCEDGSTLLLRQLYDIIQEAYGDQPETEKDIWDMRKMGLSVNLSGGHYMLNFTLIPQPWLRCLAKAFMKYATAVHSAGNCNCVLKSIVTFSRFLSQLYPEYQAADINC